MNRSLIPLVVPVEETLWSDGDVLYNWLITATPCNPLVDWDRIDAVNQGMYNKF